MQKILIVDDRRENLFALEKVLNPAGAEIIRAESGNEALIAALNHEFALAILDVQMPVMDGYEIAEHLRNEERTKALPIIFLSAVHWDEQHIFKGYHAGAVDFIIKPFDARVLLGKVNSFLQLEKLKSERSQYLTRLETLVRVSGEVLAEKTLGGLLRHVVDAACELTGAGGAAGGYDRNRVRSDSDAGSVPLFRNEEGFRILEEKVNRLLREERKSIRVTERELRSEFRMWGDDVNARHGGLLAASLQGDGGADGFIMVFDKTDGDFSEEDKTLLVELATLASLGLKHIEARVEADRKASLLALLSEELEERVQERTAALARRNEELQQFAFVASHDLSEPLRKIQTFGSLLEARGNDRLSEEEKGYISRMIGAAKRMQGLLHAVLRYSRVDTKGQDFKPAKLNEILKEVSGDLELLIRKVGARLEVEDLPIVRGDSQQLRQLFQNLIANALKYQDAGVAPHIRIFGEEDGETCRIFVEDNGIGFDEKYLEKVFQPFQRLHGEEYPGTGIGLAICKKIVERHKGAITARSTPRKRLDFHRQPARNRKPSSGRIIKEYPSKGSFRYCGGAYLAGTISVALFD